MIDPGQRDQRILIETPMMTIGDLGEEIPAWIELSRPWAKVIQTQGREFLKGDVQAETKAAFVIDYRAIDSTARVTWNGRIYMIEDVTGTKVDGETWLHCRSVEKVEDAGS